MKKLTVCNDLLNNKKEIVTWKYCAPAFIASTFVGTVIADEEKLIFKNYDKDSVRSGTLTFMSFKGEVFAITSNHVIESLEKKQSAWKLEQLEKYGYEPPMEGLELFIPIENNQYHFNYKFTSVPGDYDGIQPDIAIARVNLHSIKRLGREPIMLCEKINIPETGIASGYPEEQRDIREGENLNTFSPKFVTCTASLQVTGNGELLLQDPIESHNGVDNLSGMSGGPIIWSDEKNFGIAGVVKKGLDIQPKEGQIVTENGI